MKKLIYVLATAAIITACSGNKGYTVTGSVEGIDDGSTVYLVKAGRGEMIRLDSAIVANGKFSFKGTQDTAAMRYIVASTPEGPGMGMEFFLENGNIQVKLSETESTATGTPNNEIYQGIRNQINELSQQMEKTAESMYDSTATDEQRQNTLKSLYDLQDKQIEVLKNAVVQNIGNAVGVQLLKQSYISMEANELAPLMEQIPATYENDEAIVKIKAYVQKQQATAVGQKFTDFEMQTPDGKPVKLSDYAGKGKLVLVDFWASWCGPCRQEMPNLVEAYAKYKNKNFEIVGVSLDRTADDWKKGIETLGITWPQMSDLKYWNCEGAQLYGVNSIPHTVLIDGEGTIVARGLHGEELQDKIAELLK